MKIKGNALKKIGITLALLAKVMIIKIYKDWGSQQLTQADKMLRMINPGCHLLAAIRLYLVKLLNHQKMELKCRV